MSSDLQVLKQLTHSNGVCISDFRVLGIRVSAIQIPQVVTLMEQWIRRGECGHYIAVTGMHGISEAHSNAEFGRILNDASLVVPDGMPLVWLGRLRGYGLKRRVYGPELMMEFCKATAHNGYRHFLYGGADGVPEQLAAALRSHCPDINIVGTYSPPFRPLNGDEEQRVLGLISSANADVVWVGLSTPKQERWMAEFRNRLRVPVMVGVGAAFDFHTGRQRQAPAWMRENGLEWLFRLGTEPRRLWRRYLVNGSAFVFNVCMELLKLRKFS
jgi:N-acetylglucosaminyldiphosphoundecaprenol N-acetyl-beta-D-mannosaminyltransferase